MPRLARAIRSRPRTTPRRNAALAILTGVIAMVAVSGCGSKQVHPDFNTILSTSPNTSTTTATGVLTGDVTWSSAQGNAQVHVFSGSQRLVENTGVDKSHPQFRIALAPGTYQIEIRVSQGQLGPGRLVNAGCVKTSVQVQANHTTQVELGRKCTSSIS